VNHTRFPKEDHLPDWARGDHKVTKSDRVEAKQNSDKTRETLGYACFPHLPVISAKKGIGVDTSDWSVVKLQSDTTFNICIAKRRFCIACYSNILF